MNWKDCVAIRVQWGSGDRFTWPPSDGGFDCHPERFTISDVWGAISWVWTYPGDWLLSQEPLATFFEMTPPVIGSPASTIFGFVLFWGAIVALLTLTSDRY